MVADHSGSGFGDDLLRPSTSRRLAQNMGWYVNEELDQLWVDGYSTTDIDERAEIYGRIGEIISEDLPYVFMYRYGNAIGIVRGYTSTKPMLQSHLLQQDTSSTRSNWWVIEQYQHRSVEI